MEVGPSIEWAFSLNSKNLLNTIKTVYGIDSPYLSFLNDIFSCLKKAGCNNVPEKLKTIKDVENFSSCVSELDAAVFFLKYGKNVDIILDNDHDFDGREPDLLVKDDNFETYVEVTKLTEDMFSYLQKLLNEYIYKNKFPYRIEISYNPEASIRAFLQNRESQRNLYDKGFEEFKEKLNNNGVKLNSKICTSIGSFTLTKSMYNKGYVSQIIADTPMISLEKYLGNYIDLIKQQVIKKAKKRKYWNEKQKKNKYVVFLDYDTLYPPENVLKHALMGRFRNDVKNKKVFDAKNNGWKKYLDEYSVYNNIRSEERGIYFTEEVTKNISAVIGIYPSSPKGNKIDFEPNPFCDNTINNPDFVNFIEI